RTCGQHRARLGGKPVGLAELDAAPDAQPWEFGAAALDRVEVAGDVDAVLVLVDLHKVGMVGEGDGRKTQLDRALAAALHRTAAAVVGPLGMHVQIWRSWHASRLPVRR